MDSEDSDLDQAREGKIEKQRREILFAKIVKDRECIRKERTSAASDSRGMEDPSKRNVKSVVESPGVPLGVDDSLAKKKGQTTEYAVESLEKKARTIFIVGGSRAKRLALYGRKHMPNPSTLSNPRAYKIAEITRIGMSPTRNEGKNWLAIMEAVGIRKNDIVLIDPFSTAAWVDAVQEDNQKLLEPHMIAPVVPPLEENQALQDAIIGIKFMTGAILKDKISVVLPPNPRFLSKLCCSKHMPEWDVLIKPPTLMESLAKLEVEMEAAMSSEVNITYINLRDLASACAGRNALLTAAWARMLNQSNLFLTNEAARHVFALAVKRGTDSIQLHALAMETGRRQRIMAKMVTGLPPLVKSEIRKAREKAKEMNKQSRTGLSDKRSQREDNGESNPKEGPSSQRD